MPVEAKSYPELIRDSFQTSQIYEKFTYLTISVT
jgi:hypothetical protein